MDDVYDVGDIDGYISFLFELSFIGKSFYCANGIFMCFKFLFKILGTLLLFECFLNLWSCIINKRLVPGCLDI